MSILVTGFPTSFVALRLVEALLDEGDEAEPIICLVPERFFARAEAIKQRLPQPTRVQLIEGDVASIDMGLSGAEYMQLLREVRIIHHCAAVKHPAAPIELARRTNVQGTREVIEFAQSAGPRFERLVHWSTTLVSGKREGLIREEELVPTRFHNPIEESRFHAESIVRRAMKKGLPITILRPSIIVGDSQTGAIDRLDGPYLLILWLLNTPVDTSPLIPLPPDATLHLVPVDYAVRAGCVISKDPTAIGRTFHLVDPRPPTLRNFFDIVAMSLGRPPPRFLLPKKLSWSLLHLPGVNLITKLPSDFLEQVAKQVTYDDGNARSILSPHNIECTPFERYVTSMVQNVRIRNNREQPGLPWDAWDAIDENEDPQPLQ
ncbi:MAG: SDR family oxidoreductase [Sandaracinaceae bacterium]|nr:SDR family oxidoreductase [Sandaracinaceae bacterium]